VELWRCRWENRPGRSAKKVFLGKICDEQVAHEEAETAVTQQSAICWAYGRTLGNIAVTSQSLLGNFPAVSGDNAILPCDFVGAGKYRNGATRLWCRTHQTHWGKKADLESYEKLGGMHCANHAQRMNYVESPFTIDVSAHAEVGIWCSMPAALSTFQIAPRPPKIHVHIRTKTQEKKLVDRDFDAISILYGGKQAMFANQAITRVNITPPSAFDFVRAVEASQQLSCIHCSHCGYPHLDLGDFARKPHRKHFCGNCGRDSTWSKEPIVSTPLKPLHDTFAKNLKYEMPSRSLDLDGYQDCAYTIWASTPAIVWTAERSQEFGIHVHVFDPSGKRIVDDTFGEVRLNGKLLQRPDLVSAMIARTVI
jgi:hypothetical protein